MYTRSLPVAAIIVAVLASLSPVQADAQSTHVDIEVGYQSVDVDGDENLYRTQINQRSGFVLRGLSLHHVDSSGDATIADSFRIDASGFGGNPAGRFRLWAGLGTAYRLRLFYSRFENFSALPAYANPEIGSGVTPGQHTWDRDRQTLDLEIELFTDRPVRPLIGYRRNVIDGPRQTTYHVGQNEYRLSSDLEETEQELYAGITFNAGTVFGTVIQGWRHYRATDRLDLAADESGGNIGVPILGVDQYLDGFARSMTTEAETPVTTANIQGRISDELGFTWTYVRANIDGEASSSELLSGSLVSYRISRFFQGLDQTVESRTENPYWRAEGRVDIHFTDTVRLDVGYEASHRSLEGWALISSLYLETLNFGGLDPRDLEQLVEVDNGFDREDELITARLNVTDLGPLVLWAEVGRRQTDLDVTQDAAQIVTPGGQEGTFDRETSLLAAGLTAIFNTSRISVDVAEESADSVIVRTDFDDRVRLRGRADVSFTRWFRALLTAEYIETDNGKTGVGYSASTEHYAVDLNFDPTDDLSFRLAWDSFKTDTRMPILTPHTLAPARSEFAEDGTLLEAGLIWRISRVNLDLGYSRFDNTGSFEFDMNRAFARVGVDLTDQWAVAAEFENNDYTEEVLELARYDATRYGVYLRWHR
jgi:hypothetical protein